MFADIEEAIRLFGADRCKEMIERQIIHEWYKMKISELKSFDSGRVGAEYHAMLGLDIEQDV